MTSVNTNASATTALRTLQATNKALDATQNRISTGLKIGEAKDNAAYWSISTTLKSDNKSLATVKDALGLGAATVDVAYQGLNKAKDVLDQIKSKLTSATQAGVDRTAVQGDISALQDQLKSIASSSTFSGENWLSVDTSATNYTANKTIVASFSRDANNAVTIGTVNVDTSSAALMDSSNVANSGGILDKATSLVDATGRNLTYGGTTTGTGNGGTGGVANASVTGAIAAGTTPTSNVAGTAAVAADIIAGNGTTAGQVLTDTVNLAGVATGDNLTFKFQINGGTTQTVTVAQDGTVTAANLGTKLQTALTAAGITGVTAAASASKVQLTTAGTGTGSTFLLQDLVVTDASGKAKNPSAEVLGNGANFTTGIVGTLVAATADFTASTAAVYTSAALNGGGGWTSRFAATDMLTLNLTIDGTASEVSVAAGASVGAFIANLNNNGTFAARATASGTTSLVISSGTTGTTSTVTLDSIFFKDSTSAVKTVASSGFQNVGAAATTTTGTFVPVTLDSDDNIVFDVKVNDATAPKTVKIDAALINKTLGATANGSIAVVGDYKKVVDAALTAAGVTGISTTVVAQTLRFDTTTKAGATAKIAITDTVASGGGSQISLDDIDVSEAGLTAVGATSADQIAKTLSAYIKLVNNAITKVTTAAAALGSVSSRIDLQKTFVDTLMDTIDKGVGDLIDADLSEESTRLQALQTKQSLGVQALSIANTGTQNILRLFQS